MSGVSSISWPGDTFRNTCLWGERLCLVTLMFLVTYILCWQYLICKATENCCFMSPESLPASGISELWSSLQLLVTLRDLIPLFSICICVRWPAAQRSNFLYLILLPGLCVRWVLNGFKSTHSSFAKRKSSHAIIVTCHFILFLRIAQYNKLWFLSPPVTWPSCSAIQDGCRILSLHLLHTSCKALTIVPSLNFE